jgi:PAS domain S-box-containing protein
MPKKSLIKSLAKKLSLELLEGDIIKIAGIALTAIVAMQIVFTKGFHFVQEMKADVLGVDTHEVAETHEAIEEPMTEIHITKAVNPEPKNFYKEIVENSRSIILKWNTDGVITYMNPFGAEFFGYTQDEVIGKSAFLLVPGVESVTQRDLNQTLRDIQKDPEKFRDSANENIKKSGERVWIIWTNSTIHSDHETEILSIGNEGVRDI